MAQVDTTAQTADDPPARTRWSDVLVACGIAVIALPFVADLIAIARASHTWLITRMPDDAFYYLEIARRLGRGEGFTFDGIFQTNGFHPLWQLLLVPTAAIFDGDAGIRADLILGLVLHAIAVAIMVRFVWKAFGPGPALFGGIVAVHGSTSLRAHVNGMEGAVVPLMAVLLVVALAHCARRPTRASAALAGLASAGLVLARLDFAAVLVLLPVALWFRTRSARILLRVDRRRRRARRSRRRRVAGAIRPGPERRARRSRTSRSTA